jgi:hypothetical protein
MWLDGPFPPVGGSARITVTWRAMPLIQGRPNMRTVKRLIIVVAAAAATLLAWQGAAAAASMVEYALL